jgi:hypothetical protein
VAASLVPGASVSALAREAGIHPGQLYAPSTPSTFDARSRAALPSGERPRKAHGRPRKAQLRFCIRSNRGFSKPPALLGKQVAFTDVYAEGLEHDARAPSKRETSRAGKSGRRVLSQERGTRQRSHRRLVSGFEIDIAEAEH